MILLIRQSGTEDRISLLEKQAMDHERFKFQVLSSPLKFIRASLHHNNVNKNVEMSYVLANSFIIILKKIMLYIRICDPPCSANGSEVIT